MRPRRSWAVGIPGLIGTFLAVVLTAAPAGALAVAPTYYPDCTGQLTGTSTSTDGINTVTSWGLNLSQGTFALSYEYSRTNSTHVRPFAHTSAWIAVGPGPKSGTCLTPSHRWVMIRYSFANLAYSVHLRANCTSSTVPANASYKITLEANLYDASKASFVWATNLTHLVGHRAISCTPGNVVVFAHQYNILGPINVTGRTGALRTTDQYSFVFGVHSYLDESKMYFPYGNRPEANGSISNLAVNLAGISCPRC